MAQIKRDLFCISVRPRNYCSVLFEHTQGIRIGDAELRTGLHLATIGTDKPLGVNFGLPSWNATVKLLKMRLCRHFITIGFLVEYFR
jgi:hypothetical protein